jgi:uncharacterized protein
VKRIVRILLALVAFGYLGIVGATRVSEKSMVYHPAERTVDEPSPALNLRQRDVRYASADGTKLSAWIIPAAARDSSGMWLLVCHGNYGNIGYGDRPEFYAFARDLGLNILTFDYRGFGASEGAPDEEGLYQDALASWRYLTDSLRVPPTQIVIFGHSLGSGVATDLATRVDAAGLVLEGAFTSVVDRGAELYPLLPVRLIASQRFESIAKIGRVGEPSLFLHSPEDDVIPFAHGERLLAAARNPKRLVSVRGGHMSAYSVDKATYFGALATLVAEVTPSPLATSRNAGAADQGR